MSLTDINFITFIFLSLAVSCATIPECSAVQLGLAKSTKNDLGRGVQGVVRKINQNEVVKIMEIDPTNNSLADAQREISIMMALKSYPRASQLIDACVEKKDKDTRFYIFMEACESELFDYLDKSINTHKDFYFLLLELLSIFRDINSMGVFHIDNQPRNVMICHRKVKLIDFGKGFINTTATSNRQRGIEIMNLENLFRSIKDRVGFQDNSLNQLFMRMRSQGMLARRNQPLTITLDEIEMIITEFARIATDEPLPKNDGDRKKGGEFIVANSKPSVFSRFSSMTKNLLSPLKFLKEKGVVLYNKAFNRNQAEPENKNEKDVVIDFEAIIKNLNEYSNKEFNSPDQWDILEKEALALAEKDEQLLLKKSLSEIDESHNRLVI